jgi:superfamily II DNA or RNA helicase
VLLVTLGCFSTGVNIPGLTDMILLSPVFNNELLIHQLRGRLMRKAEGKRFGFFHFLWDVDVFPQKKLTQFLRILKN